MGADSTVFHGPHSMVCDDASAHYISFCAAALGRQMRRHVCSFAMGGEDTGVPRGGSVRNRIHVGGSCTVHILSVLKNVFKIVCICMRCSNYLSGACLFKEVCRRNISVEEF